MAEKLSNTILKIKKGLVEKPEKNYTKVQIDFDVMFEEHALKVCPDFKTNNSIESIKLHFLKIAAGKTKKGILVYGNVGVGKSTIFKIFNSIGKQIIQEYNSLIWWFVSCTAPWLVNEKMASTTQNYAGNFNYDTYTKGKLYIDDLGMESLCFNNYELLTKLLFERHRNDAMTFVSTNMTPKEILKRYGPQVFDRLGEMFEIIKWDGNSLRE